SLATNDEVRCRAQAQTDQRRAVQTSNEQHVARLERRDGIALTIVVPAHDEAPNLERLLSELHAALDPTSLAWELIVVDDGSTDETPRVLAGLAVDDPRLRPFRLPTRSGQTAALVAGFRAAAAPLIATLDADLQCPP